MPEGTGELYKSLRNANATMFAERWKVIPHNRRYLVSDEGRVMNAKTARILKPRLDSKGEYLRVKLGRKSPEFSVQKLVLDAFVGPCPEGLERDHIDRDKHNNALSNLRYVTHAKNIRNRRLLPGVSGLRGVTKKGKKWRARLHHNGKDILNCAGLSKREAALMYIGALALIDEEDAANAQAEYDAYESDEEDNDETEDSSDIEGDISSAQ
jgi:hypothetical protein